MSTFMGDRKMKNEKHHVLRTENCKSEASELRGSISTQAEKTILAERFEAVKAIDTPTIWITDNETGRLVQVSLFAYEEVRKVLNVLFSQK